MHALLKLKVEKDLTKHNLTNAKSNIPLYF